MATVPAAVTKAKQNGFESFLSAAAKDIEKVLNVGINLATAEQPLINQLLPPQFATAENAATALIKNVMLTTEAKYQALENNGIVPTKSRGSCGDYGCRIDSDPRRNRSNSGTDRVDRLSYRRDKFQHFADSRVNDAECCSKRSSKLAELPAREGKRCHLYMISSTITWKPGAPCFLAC